MTNEEKQKYIDAISTQMRSIAEECDENLQFEYDVLKLALASLTAQAVKKPQTHDAHGFPEPAHIINSRWIESIREAGYEVQE